jgi:hypothetical protein
VFGRLHDRRFDAGDIERAGGVVVADGGAIGVEREGFVGAGAGCVGAIEADDNTAAAVGVAAGAEPQALLAEGGRVPCAGLAGAAFEPGEPVALQVAALRAAKGFGVVDLGDGAEADELFKTANVVGLHEPRL